MAMEGGERQSATDPNDKDAYKQSNWANLIDSYIHSVEEEKRAYGGHISSEGQAMTDWAEWMISGGYSLTDKEIGEKAREILGTDEPEQPPDLELDNPI